MEARRLVRHLKVVEREEGCLDTADAIVEWEHWCKNVTTVEGKIEMFPVAADTIKGWSEVPESEYPVASSSFQAAAPIPTSSLATLTLDCPAPNDHPPSKNMFTLICSLLFCIWSKCYGTITISPFWSLCLSCFHRWHLTHRFDLFY